MSSKKKDGLHMNTQLHMDKQWHVNNYTYTSGLFIVFFRMVNLFSKKSPIIINPVENKFSRQQQTKNIQFGCIDSTFKHTN